MKFLDKFTQIAEKVAATVEQTATTVTKAYKEQGVEGMIKKTSDGFNTLSKKTQDYYTDIGNTNKKIMDANKSNKIEDKIATAAAVVVNTTQTIMEDAVKVTVDTVKSAVKTENPDNTGLPAKLSETASSYLKSDQLTQAELVGLDSTPLEIAMKYLGATPADRIPGKWTLNDTGHNIQITTHENKWYDFNAAMGGQGAVSFMTAVSLNHTKTDDPATLKMAKDEAVAMLQACQDSPQYRTELSLWIKEQNAIQEKKNSVTVTDSQKEAFLEAIGEEAPKKTSTRKAKKQATSDLPNPAEEVVVAKKKGKKTPVLGDPAEEVVVAKKRTPKM